MNPQPDLGGIAVVEYRLEVVDGPELGARLDRQQAQLEQPHDRRDGFDPQNPQRVSQPGQRDRRGLGQGEEREGQPRIDRQPRDQCLDGGGLVQMLRDLVRAAGRADPRAVGESALRQPDRGEARPFVAAQCRAVRQARSRARRARLGASGAERRSAGG